MISGFDDIVKSPRSVYGKSSEEMKTVLGEGWEIGTYGSKGNGWKLTKGDKWVFYHPGGGRHVGDYYGFSGAQIGKNKVVGSDYVPTINDKANIINY